MGLVDVSGRPIASLSKGPEAKPLYDDKGYTEDARNLKAVDYISNFKKEYYESDHFKFVRNRAETLKHLYNMTHKPGAKKQKYGIIGSLTQGVFHNYIDSLEDLFDQDELVTATALKSGNEAQTLAEDLASYANNILQNTEYIKHLFKRFPYLLFYGHSPAFDSWVYNTGWAVKPKYRSVGPGEIDWTREADVTLNRVKSYALHPLNTFADITLGIDDQTQRGYIKRWYLQDVHQALARKTKSGEPVYNQQALQKLIAMMAKGENTADDNYYQDGKRDQDSTEVGRNRFTRQSYIDVTYYRGNLQGAEGFRDDPNIYEVECTKGMCLRITEQPVDLFCPMTDMMTHPHSGSPFGATYLDSIVPHQKVGDTVQNLMLENLVDSMHRIYAYKYEDIRNLEDLRNPRGMQTFLEINQGGQVPVMLGDQRSGSFQDALKYLEILDNDRKRFSASDQELGVGSEGQTATEAKILLSSGSKRLRAGVKRISRYGVVPQIRHIIFQSMVHQTPEQRQVFTRGGDQMQIGPKHFEALLTGALIRINDNVTRDKYADSMKAAEFYINAFKIAPALNTPDNGIKLIRYLGKEQGIKDIDVIFPEPMPVQIPGQDGPAMPGMPPQPAAPEPVDYEAMMNQMGQPQPEEVLNAVA